MIINPPQPSEIGVAKPDKLFQLYDELIGVKNHPDRLTRCNEWTNEFNDLICKYVVATESTADKDIEAALDAWIELLQHVATAPFNTKAGALYEKARARAGNRRKELRRMNAKYNRGPLFDIMTRQNAQIEDLKKEIAALKRLV